MKMTKKLGFSVGALVLAGVVGIGIYQSDAASASSKLSSDEFELILNSDTGEVVNEKQREDSDDAKNVSIQANEGTKVNTDFIGDKKAKEIALNEFNGSVTDFELDEDDDRYVYEIEVRNNNKEAEFEIDAVSGEILEMEIDTDDDDNDDD